MIHGPGEGTPPPYKPSKDGKSMSSNPLLFRVYRSQPVFLKVDWSTYQGSPDEYEMSKHDYLKRTLNLGWYDTGFRGWGADVSLLVRFCRAGDLSQLPIAESFPAYPSLIASPEDVVGRLYESDSLPTTTYQFVLSRDAHRLLLAEDYDGLEVYLDETSRAEAAQRSKTGVSKLAVIYHGLSGLAESTKDEEWIAHRAQFEHWQKQRPKSVHAKICLAWSYLKAGWRARGTGPGATVTAENAAKLRERATKARSLLQQAQREMPGMPAVNAGLIGCAQALGGDKASVRQYLQQALEANPTDIEVLHHAASYFSPSWYGSGEEELRLAEQAAELTSTEAGEMQYATVACHLARGGSYTVMHSYGFDWKRIKQGFADYRRLFPAGRELHHSYWLLACIAGDKEEARLCFDELGTSYNGAIRHLSLNGYLDWRESILGTPPEAQIARVMAHDVHLPDVVFTPDGQQIVTGGRDERVRIWDRVPAEAKLTTALANWGRSACIFSPTQRGCLCGP